MTGAEERLRYWIRERHEVYLRRAAGEMPPWTVDPMLADYHFCNVFRDLDRTTLWLINNLYAPLKGGVFEPDLWMLAAIVRFINHVPTLEPLLRRIVDSPFGYTEGWYDEVARGALRRTFAERAQLGKKLYGNAYMIRAESNAESPWFGKPKIEYLIEEVWSGLWRERATFRDTFALKRGSVTRATAAFANTYGLGGFMAYEITTDLTYTNLLGHAQDRHTYAHLGPGAIRGLDRVVERTLRPAERLSLFIDLLVRLQRDPPTVRAIHARDLEHSLCEFDKYERLRTGGTYHRRYRAGGGQQEVAV